jgi:uncharacterized protein YjeT (DUF2065 family)
MDSSTLFLVQVFGSLFFLMGLGMMFNASFYMKAFSALKESPMSVMLAGAINIVAGVSILFSHFLWSTPLETIMTVLGIIVLAKGVHATLAPEHWMKMVGGFVNSSFMKWSSVVIVLLSACLLWAGFGA